MSNTARAVATPPPRAGAASSRRSRGSRARSGSPSVCSAALGFLVDGAFEAAERAISCKTQKLRVFGLLGRFEQLVQGELQQRQQVRPLGVLE